ncbi:MAG: neutral/alkaline non-lysosomal ceramidase N-terminal domain-containing protein [Desulfatibacillaceae bacterium]
MKGNLLAEFIQLARMAPGFFTNSRKQRPLNLSIPLPEPLPAEDLDTPVAGAARVDITPPPGMPMGGYSAMGHFGRGFRTRLHARCLYVKPATGRPVALVALDLLSGSLALHARVAELAAASTDVAAGGLVLCGTHTHSAPANYFESVFYNRHASNAAGFEPRFFEYLSTRVAHAVVRAYESRRPARVAAGSKRVWGATRNRSVAAYRKNLNLEPGSRPGAHEAVNPVLSMIRADCLADDGNWYPAGAFSTFSIHATAVSENNHLYNADVFARIAGDVEHGAMARHHPPWDVVHAAANATHGDNTPDIPGKIGEGFPWAGRIGAMVGKKALDLFESLGRDMDPDVAVGYSVDEVDVQLEPEAHGISLADPAVGMSLTGGATSRPAPLLHRLPLFAPEWPRKNPGDSPHAGKNVFGGRCQGLFVKKEVFPRRLMLQAVRVADTVLLPLPFEITCQMGARIAAAAERRCRTAGLAQVARFVPVSCANGYWGYMTTPEEYSLQYYEGGHTLYGPNTGPYVAARLSRVAAGLAGETSRAELPPKRHFNLLAADYLPAETGIHPDRRVLGQPAYTPARGSLQALYAVSWMDAPPGDLAWDGTLARVEARSDGGGWAPLFLDGRAVDDRGFDVSVEYGGAGPEPYTGSYTARWHSPVKTPGTEYRFAVLGEDGEGVAFSQPF